MSIKMEYIAGKSISGINSALNFKVKFTLKFNSILSVLCCICLNL